ncbi:MAG: hypothetical protein JO038_09055 [Alphaproteobacteria bacterium]|nr:hypothetical protein [Alphaproteobacteria bacterium]
MMFLIRTTGEEPRCRDIAVKVRRRTPAILPDSDGKVDFFCVGEPETMETLRAQGWTVVELRDGWYADDEGGGVAIFGHGKFWEVRDTPFSVKEAAGPTTAPAEPKSADPEAVNVRGAIFGV